MLSGVLSAGALIVGGVACTGLALYGYSQSCRADEAEAGLEMYKAAALRTEATLKDVMSARDAALKALAEREDVVADMSRRNMKLQSDLREAYRDDKAVHDWADAVVPPTIVRMLYEDGVRDGDRVSEAGDSTSASGGDADAKSHR